MKAYQLYNLLLEPHGAVAWEGLHRDFIANPHDGDVNQLSISLETAHPAKFPSQIKEILNITPPLPDSLNDIKSQTEEYVSLDNDYKSLQDFLRKNYATD